MSASARPRARAPPRTRRGSSSAPLPRTNAVRIFANAAPRANAARIQGVTLAAGFRRILTAVNKALVRATLARLVVRRDGPLDEAAQHAARAAALAPDAPDVWKALACVARARGDLDEAFSRYDAVVRACPGDVEAHEALSGLYRRWGVDEEAVQHARLAVAARGDLPGPYVALSRALRRAGDEPGAVDAARRALERQSDHAPARAALAAALPRDAAERAAFAWPAEAQLEPDAVVDLAEGLARSGEARRALDLLDARRSRCASAFGRAALQEARAAMETAGGGS